VSAEPLQDIVERILLVPDQHRVYDHDETTAAKVFGIGIPVQSDLLDLGLPHRVSGGQRYFDELDLANASLALRTPSPRYLAMRRWPQILRGVVADHAVRYEVEVAAQCGSKAADHQCDFRLPAEVLALVPGTDPAARRFTLSREVGATGPAAEASEDLQRVFAEVSAFQFHILPLALYGDLSFLADTSLANCELSSRYLAQRATAEGWTARRSFGLQLFSPYSLQHFWPEVRLDGVWTAFDPFMIHSLVRWEVLTPGEVSPAQVLNSAVFRIAEEWVDMVLDAGQPARVSLLTRRRAQVGGADGVTAAEISRR